MKQGSKRKLIIISLGILIIISLGFFLFLNLKRENISADVITNADIKTVDLMTPESDIRQEVVIPIIMYHHIRSFDDPDDTIGTNLSVSEDDFKKQIDYLNQNGYTTITFENMAKFPNEVLPEKPVILTFDDGYDDNYLAFEMLRENQFLGVFYIISNYLGRAGHLTPDQVVEISDTGMEIGSHTVNHLNLTNLSDQQLKSELLDSKVKLEKLIGKEVISLCYPSGKYSSVTTEAAKNIGYKTATTTNTGIAKTSDPMLELTRIRVGHSESLQSFINKLRD